MVHSIYLPPLRDEYLTAKNFTKIIPYRVGQPIQPTNISIFDYIPSQEYFYFKHIAKINEAFPNKVCLLLQHTKELMDIYTLEKYVNAGISKFCVGSINQAKIIKKKWPNAEITGSITMKVMPDDLINNLEIYKKYFNNFVLWFPYNKNFDLLKQLPKDFNYSILVNCTCSNTCPGFHWLAESEQQELNYCKTCNCKKDGYNLDNDSIYIRPYNLKLYNDYVDFYKFQGREHSTPLIISDIAKYTGFIVK